MSNNKPTLMLIDGHSLAFRAFYALDPARFRTSDGQHTNAIHGFLSMLLNLIQQEQPDAIGIAFDISRHSFRTEEYPEYKGTRGATPEEFKGQVPLLQEALGAMGIKTLEKENFEADDILATLATRGAENGYQVLVVSGDRDTIQLVTDDVTLLYPSKGGVRELTRFTPEAVVEKYSVRPEQYPDIAALVGETSDNLPGIPGVGPKTAVKWITQYGSLADILAHQDEITGKVGESLRENAHLAERNRRLNKLVRDVELPVTVADLKDPQINVEQVKEVFGKLQFKSLTARVLGMADGVATASVATETNEAIATKTAERKALPPVQHLIDEELGAWLTKQENVAVAFENTALADTANLREEQKASDVGVPKTIIVGLATESERIEFSWQIAGLDYKMFEEWLASDKPKTVWDLKNVSKLMHAFDREIGGVTGDAYLLEWLISPQKAPDSLASSALKHLDEKLPEAPADQLVPEVTEGAVAHHAWAIWHLHAELFPQLPDVSIPVYQDIELPLAPVLADLEMRGITMDTAVLEAQLAELTAQTDAAQERAFASIGGKQVNLSSPKQLQSVLFEDLGMPPTRKTQRGYSTDAKSLAELQEKNPHPFLDALMEYRENIKLKQIVEGLLKAVQADGKIHTTLQQIGAATGRLSSDSPNLQNIPARTETGRRIREGFTHGAEFETLLTADYSQVEMRIMAHLSGDPELISAFNAGEDLHRYVGSRIFGVEPADVTSQMRAKVKAMSYGLAYGLSAFGLAKQLNITNGEAQQLMADYFSRFGRVRDYLHDVVEDAKQRGYTETINGRRRPFPEFSNRNRAVQAMAERAALNAPIQGTAADIMKIAMLKVWHTMRDAGLRSRMLLQIHDELMFEVYPGEKEQLTALVTEAMSSAVKLRVPLEASVGEGANWNAAQH